MNSSCGVIHGYNLIQMYYFYTILNLSLRAFALAVERARKQRLYARYPIVSRALGLAAFRPSASREQRYLAYKSKGILHTITNVLCNRQYQILYTCNEKVR